MTSFMEFICCEDAGGGPRGGQEVALGVSRLHCIVGLQMKVDRTAFDRVIPSNRGQSLTSPEVTTLILTVIPQQLTQEPFIG